MTSGTLRDRLQQSLGASYALDRELGGGGMSHVFVATETALHRRVVVKVLPPSLAEGISAERFTREITLAANLQDPHIVPVLAAGVAGTLPWFTMPYVEGESLRARLMRGTIPYGEALGILRDVALALEYAHAHGVVHRDIKPENVLLAGRTAVVADFGIAKALSAARTDAAGGGASATLTSVGQSLGTPAYMAPEQAAGDPVDHRADIYAWGVMAWELLAGRHPFADKSSTQQLIAAQIAEKPMQLATAKPGIAPPLAAFVMRCLEKSPAARPSSAGAIIEALDGMVTPGGTSGAEQATRTSRRRIAVAAALIGVAVLAVGGTMYARRDTSDAAASAADEARRIAVLPFENLGDSANAYFADGMTDAVRGKLTSLGAVEVIARGSSSPYAHTTKPPKQIAAELGVRYLLTGTVRFAKDAAGGARVQVSPALVEVGADGAAANRWEQPFDAGMADVFKVQGQIAEQVVDAMRVVLDRTSRGNLTRALTSVPGAYDAYLRGEAAWDAGQRQDAASLRRAMGEYERAVALDPRFVAAWGALARSRSVYSFNVRPGYTTEETQAKEAVERAYALDSTGVDGLLAMGTYVRVIRGNLSGALELVERARAEAPNNAAVLGELGVVQGDLGRFDEADATFALAARLDPRNVRVLNSRTRILWRKGDITGARANAERAVAVSPSNIQAVAYRTITEVAAGDLPAAQRVVTAGLLSAPREGLIAYFGQFYELGWILTPDQERVLIGSGPEAFGRPEQWAIVKAEQFLWRGERAMARAWADSAVRYNLANLGAALDPQARLFYGLAMAIAGDSAKALREARTAIADQSKIRGAEQSLATAYFYHVAAQVAAAAGDRKQSLEWLAEARRLHYYATPAWIRLEPSFRAFHGDPEFERILSAK